MSNLQCINLGAFFGFLFQTCTVSQHARRLESEEKLKTQLAVQTFQVNELDRKIMELDVKKCSLMKQTRTAEARECVVEKHKLLKRLTKIKEMQSFTEGLLENITETSMMHETMHTLTEAQSVFKAIDAPKLYKRFDKLSNQYQDFRTSIMDNQEMVAGRMGEMNPIIDDAALLEELASMEYAELPQKDVTVQEPLRTVALAYANYV